MGLHGDPRVPPEVKWGHLASHMRNMRWSFPPCGAYPALRRLLALSQEAEGKDASTRDAKEYFVHTSNVDGCFERSGFDRARVYTPQV
jgi:hypothetical protein